MSAILRVILDDRPLRRTRTGVGHYVAQLLEWLPRVAPDIHVDPFVFTHLSREGWGDRGTEGASGQGTEAAALRDQGPRDRGAQPRDVGGGRKPWWLRRTIQAAYGVVFRFKTRGRYDLYHEPNHIPVRCDLLTITTIHDLSVHVHPQWHPRDRVRWYEADFERGVRQTRHFIAASEFTRREMVRLLGVAPDRITVTYQSPRAAFTARLHSAIETPHTGGGLIRARSASEGPCIRARSASEGPSIRARSASEGPPVPTPSDSEGSVIRAASVSERAALDLPERFFLYVGTLEPRKNVAGLLEAYAALPAAVRRSHPLLIAGAWGWKADALRQKLAERHLQPDVRLLGYLHDAELAAVYAACTALVWPTLYEGFGLPPLEAMACGAPVIVSNAASLPEVVGDAGVLLDPHDTAAWTEALRRMAEDEAWRAALRARGLRQAARFSWERCARETAACYRAVARNGGGA